MSLAAARTDNAYSTLIAKQLGLKPYSDEYHFADWNDSGIPEDAFNTYHNVYDIARLLRRNKF